MDAKTEDEIKQYIHVEKLTENTSWCLNELLRRSGLYIKETKIEKFHDVITAINLYNHFNDKSLGTLEYNYTKKDNSLFITHLDRYCEEDIKIYTTERIFITITELLIYKLIIDNYTVKTIYLYATPESIQIDKKFCLMCYYEKLGFYQYYTKNYIKVIKHCKKEIRRKSMSKNERDELYDYFVRNKSACLSCKCVKFDIDLGVFDLSLLSLEMKYVLDNIEKLLSDIRRKIC